VKCSESFVKAYNLSTSPVATVSCKIQKVIFQQYYSKRFGLFRSTLSRAE